jgi:acyl-CoA reductase-like NAD-dependent aldehyde dehydrogenase
MADDDRMFIAGEWVGSESAAASEATSPSTGEVIGPADLGRGLRFADRVRTGWVNVNDLGTNYRESHLPFGGRAGSASAVGRVGGRFSIER